MRKYQDPEVVSASEIASYAFCPEAWRLGSALGLRPNNEAKIRAGEGLHAATARVEERSQSALRLGVTLLVLGAVALAVLLVLAR